MPIFKTPWDTTSRSGAVMTPTIKALDSISLSRGSAQFKTIKPGEYEDGFEILMVTGGNSIIDAIKYFNHPVILPTPGPNGVVPAIDVRGFGKWDAVRGDFHVRNMPEYKMMVMRACMNYFWLTRRPTIMRDMTTLPIKLFASMISETIKRTYSLDLGEQLRLSILAAYFYLGLFTDAKEFSESEQHKVTAQIIAATNAPNQLIEEVLDDLPIIADILTFCDVCKKRVGSVRLDDFNYGILLSAIGGVWYATNGHEILTIALEHPPTWLMIVYACISEATFRRSPLAQMAEKQGKSGSGQAFTASINSLFGGDRCLKEIFEQE